MADRIITFGFDGEQRRQLGDAFQTVGSSYQQHRLTHYGFGQLTYDAMDAVLRDKPDALLLRDNPYCNALELSRVIREREYKGVIYVLVSEPPRDFYEGSGDPMQFRNVQQEVGKLINGCGREAHIESDPASIVNGVAAAIKKKQQQLADASQPRGKIAFVSGDMPTLSAIDRWFPRENRNNPTIVEMPKLYEEYTGQNFDDIDLFLIDVRKNSDYWDNNHIPGLDLSARLRADGYKGKIMMISSKHKLPIENERIRLKTNLEFRRLLDARDSQPKIIDDWESRSEFYHINDELKEKIHKLVTQNLKDRAKPKPPGGKILYMDGAMSHAELQTNIMQEALDNHSPASHQIEVEKHFFSHACDDVTTLQQLQNYFGKDLSGLQQYDLLMIRDGDTLRFARLLRENPYNKYKGKILIMGRHYQGNEDKKNKEREKFEKAKGENFFDDHIEVDYHVHHPKEFAAIIDRLINEKRQELLSEFLSEWRRDADRAMKRMAVDETSWPEKSQIPENLLLILPGVVALRAERVLRECRSKYPDREGDALRLHFEHAMNARLTKLVNNLLDEQGRLVDGKPRGMNQEEKIKAGKEREAREKAAQAKKDAEKANQDALAAKHAQEDVAWAAKRNVSQEGYVVTTWPFAKHSTETLLSVRGNLEFLMEKRMWGERFSSAPPIRNPDESLSDFHAEENKLPDMLDAVKRELAVREAVGNEEDYPTKDAFTAQLNETRSRWRQTATHNLYPKSSGAGKTGMQ